MIRWRLLLIVGLLLLVIQACGPSEVNSDAKPVSHALWDQLLNKHVSANGRVNYKGFQADSVQLNSYLKLLESAHPNEANWSTAERMAYWINAYNAYTVKLILKHYPVKSIKDIGGAIPFVNSSWDIRFIVIEGNTYDLNNIEHGILRQRFNDPRIHFAINCASVSCPNLRAEAYTAKHLDTQLDEQAVLFINDPNKNQLSTDPVRVSKIFSWFEGDFTTEGSLMEFLNQYAEQPIPIDVAVRHLDYNWSLNE